MQNSAVEWLDFAKELAIKAGEMIVASRSESTFVRDYKIDHELVTTTDIAVDQHICSSILARYPLHCILSEESSPNLDLAGVGDSTPVWVIDPIDGTVNFAHGHHHVAVSIGLYVGDERILGVVNAPFLDECFWAIKGEGAYCNGKPLTVSGAKEPRNALVATGFPYQKDALLPILERVSRILHHCQDVRRNGSAALDLCWVASGRLDAYFESVKPWDMAAGTLIAEEAGALVGRYLQSAGGWPDVVNGEGLLVSTPDLFEAMLALTYLEK
ncbi:MAG: inositol monophosphatase family protein [Marinomonas foliarum]|uniref:inositol monophosphatase family protein n=1 Tax=Marinomonas foliarum TaxID=491950 RepID=UPI003F9B841A